MFFIIMQLIEMILAKLDWADDLSNCALVCRQWLDIINKHRAIETSIVFGRFRDTGEIHSPFLRHFKSVCFQSFNSTRFPFPEVDIIKLVCQQAKVVKFKFCDFSNLGQLKQIIMACGDMSRLEIVDSSVNDVTPMENAENASAISKIRSKQIINTLAIQIQYAPENFCRELFAIVQELLLNDVANIELEGPAGKSLDGLEIFLEEHHDKVRKLDVLSDKNPRLSEILRKFSSHLKLDTFTIRSNLDENCVSEVIRSQPAIAELRVFGTYAEAMKVITLSNMLTVLELVITTISQLNVIRDSVHRLRTLSKFCLLVNSAYSENVDTELNITFIAMLPKLREFHCRFFQNASVKLSPINDPMLQLKKFNLYFDPDPSNKTPRFDIDGESMWNIYHKMPNLEQLTVHESSNSRLVVCIIVIDGHL
jgi:F-box-like